MLNQYFDKIYCINLDKRPDRWEKSKLQFDNLNIEVERFSAFEPDSGSNKLRKGELGVLLSNLAILKEAKEKNYNSILIFEDDVEFHPQFGQLFDSFYNEVPANWDMIYFGGNHVGGASQVSINILKIYGSYAIHSIVVRNTMFDWLIENIAKAEKPVDVYYADLHRSHNVYCFYPHLAWQRPDFSDINQCNVDYDFLRR